MGVLRVGRVVLMLVVAVGVMPPAALAAGWSVVPSAPLQVPAGSLSGVSCVSTSACTAVGHYTNKAGDEVTLAERWDGTSWAIQTTPNPTGAIGSELSGVSCVSAQRVHRRRPLHQQSERDDVGGAVGRDELGDPDHPQPHRRHRQRAVRGVVRVGQRVHRRRPLHQQSERDDVGGAVGRDELGDPDHPQQPVNPASCLACRARRRARAPPLATTPEGGGSFAERWGRDELGDPDHPQPRRHPAVWRVVRVGERLHRRRQLLQQQRGVPSVGGAVGRDELGDPDRPQTHHRP